MSDMFETRSEWPFRTGVAHGGPDATSLRPEGHLLTFPGPRPSCRHRRGAPPSRCTRPQGVYCVPTHQGPGRRWSQGGLFPHDDTDPPTLPRRPSPPLRTAGVDRFGGGGGGAWGGSGLIGSGWSAGVLRGIDARRFVGGGCHRPSSDKCVAPPALASVPPTSPSPVGSGRMAVHRGRRGLTPPGPPPPQGGPKIALRGGDGMGARRRRGGVPEMGFRAGPFV